VISEMAEKMNVMSSRILLVLNDRTIHSYDSPQSLGLQVADIVCKYIRFILRSNDTKIDNILLHAMTN
jgi:uncharacterized protein involved in tolerance to divalent cations